MPLPMRLTVVSWPAMKSSITWSTSSSAERRSPSSSAAMSAGEQVVGRVRALPLDRVEHVLDHVVGRVDDVVEVLQARASGSSPSVSVCAQLAQLVAVGVGHAEHLGDHLERQREGEVGDHVASSVAARDHARRACRRPVACTRGASCSIIRGREHLLHQPADAGVVGRVEVEDPPGAPLRPVAEDLLADSARGLAPDHAAVLDAQRGVAQEADAVVVAEERPQAEGLRCTGLVAQSSAYCGYGSSAKPGSKGLKGLGSLVTSATVATSPDKAVAGST